jgi:hypothetical protein
MATYSPAVHAHIVEVNAAWTMGLFHRQGDSLCTSTVVDMMLGER